MAKDDGKEQSVCNMCEVHGQRMAAMLAVMMLFMLAYSCQC